MEDCVSAMKFGRFGREDNTLVLVTNTGKREDVHKQLLVIAGH